MMLVFILAVCFSSCKDSKDDTSAPYDPNLPVEVTDFTPKSGGGKKKMIIYGSNFGIDCSIISVKVGGKEAIVISSKGTSIYCSTPESCFEGTVEIKIGEQTVIASENISTNHKW
jgi:IPT/TIG domain.